MSALNQSKKSQQSIHFSLPKEATEGKVSLLSLISQLTIITFIYVSILLSLIHYLSLENISLYLIFIGTLVVGLHFYVRKKWQKPIVFYLVFVLQILSVIIFQKYIVNGFFLTINKLVDVIGHHKPILLKQYVIDLEAEYYTMAINSFWLQVSILFAFFIMFLIEKRLYLLITLFVLGLFTFQIYLGVVPNKFDNILLLIILLLSLHQFFVNYSGKGIRVRIENPSLHATLMILLGVFMVSISLLLFNLSHIEDLKKPPFLMNAREGFTASYERFKYGEDATNSFTEGDLGKLGDLDLKEEVALEVMMTQPESYYLRGFVGAKYDGKKWSPLEPSITYENYPLFYWLEEESFLPLQQLNKTMELGSPEEEQAENQVIINNIQASSKYMYSPYEIKSKLNIDEELNYFQEANMLTGNFFGHRNYQFQANSNLVKYYPKIANRLYKARDEKEVGEYLQLESHYNQFIYEHYTDITDRLRTFYDLYVDPSLLQGDERIPYEEAIEFVEKYLEQNLDYEESVQTIDKDDDFVITLIDQVKTGYAPHYATVATTLFRYLGIPARYVEGFLITPDMIKDKKEFDLIQVTGKEAHVWTEIYIDEVGWIPLEFTPAYEDVMEPTDMSEYPKGKWTADMQEDQGIKGKDHQSGSKEKDSDDSLADSSNVEKIEDENADNDNGDGSGGGKASGDGDQTSSGSFTEEIEEEVPLFWKVLLIILLILFILLFILYLIYFIKKRFELRKLKQSFYGEDLNKATIRLFSYTLLLFHYDGIEERKGSTKKYVKDISLKYSSVFGQEFKDIIDLAQVAAYSNRTITEEEREKALQYAMKILEKLKERKSFFQKIKMRMWDFIY